MPTPPSSPPDAATVIDWLRAKRTVRDLENLEKFGITAPKAIGVSVANIQAIAKRTGRSHALAEALWKTGWYEARLLAAFVDEPARVTASQMDRWSSRTLPRIPWILAHPKSLAPLDRGRSTAVRVLGVASVRHATRLPAVPAPFEDLPRRTVLPGRSARMRHGSSGS